MKSNHPPYHWITVALVSAAALLTITEASGQATGAAAVFEGRPAMAGAQAGQGAMAGPPQGGIGLQGSEGTQLNLRRPASVAGMQDMPQGRMDEPPAALAATSVAGAAPADKGMEPARDKGSVAKEARGSAKTARKAARRTMERTSTGVVPIDSGAPLK